MRDRRGFIVTLLGVMAAPFARLPKQTLGSFGRTPLVVDWSNDAGRTWHRVEREEFFYVDARIHPRTHQDAIDHADALLERYK